MRHNRQCLSFITVKVWLLTVLCVMVQLSAAFAQDKPVDGIVFDKDSKERIAKVSILNTRSGGTNYDNLKAEFKITARTGDVLIFAKTGYANDTVKVGTDASLIIYLKRTSIELKEVSIKEAITPQQKLFNTKRDFTKIYGTMSDKDLLTTGGNGGGAGLSIDALYNMFSFSGRNATRLRATIDRDYRENVIDYRFTHTLVANVTGLEEPKLTDFMMKYRPGYYFVLTANDYDFIRFIRTNYTRYLRNPDAYTLPPLRP